MAIEVNELARTLRELAERIEAADLPLTRRCRMKLSVHGVKDRDELRQWAKFMRKPEPDQNDGTHWIREESDALDVTVFYAAGLLSATKPIQCEAEADSAAGLAQLIEEPVAVS